MAVGLAVLVVGLVEVQSLLQTLRSQARLRERVVRSQRQAILGGVPPITAVLGGSGSWPEAARDLRRSAGASEVEILDASGHPARSEPSAAPVRHWPSPSELRALESGAVLTLGPIGGDEARLITYVALRVGGPVWYLRLSTAAPDLVEDLRERRQVVLGHSIALLVLVVTGGLALFPGPREGEAAVPGALHAYEEAMDRLRVRGQEILRQHEAELRVLEEHIEDTEAMARAGELTAGIGHEVRNGLGTIVGYARLLEKSAESPEAAEAARRVLEECETLEGVIRRFMEFVRTEELNFTRFGLSRMLSRVVARESRSRPGAAVEVPAAGPEGDAILADEELLERAFENLVRNAREAAGAEGHVVIGVEAQGDHRIVRIADDGPGLPAATQERIRPFLTTKAGGLGLGLPLALKIIRLHDGRLDLAENHPRGLLVTVRLPAEPQPAHEQVVTEGTDPARRLNLAGKNGRDTTH